MAPGLRVGSPGPPVRLQAGGGTEGEVEVVEGNPAQQGLPAVPAATVGKREVALSEGDACKNSRGTEEGHLGAELGTGR